MCCLKFLEEMCSSDQSFTGRSKFFFKKEMFQHCIFIVKFCDFARVFPFLINNEVLTWKQETFT